MLLSCAIACARPVTPASPAALPPRVSQDFIRACRLFCGEPVWKPYPRGEDSDKMAARTEYLKQMTAAA